MAPRIEVRVDISLHETIKALIKHSESTELMGLLGCWLTYEELKKVRKAVDIMEAKLNEFHGIPNDGR